jgi:hypothetical protein
MQQITPRLAPTQLAPMQLAAIAMPKPSEFPPQAMAHYLRRTSGSAAFCFARAMHEDSAWANENWGEYWADVMRLV